MGCGHIARKMADTLSRMTEAEACAVASRSEERARAFAAEWHIGKAYGSYEALVADPEIDLVYIATPHSEHYRNATLCISGGKPVLCEKAFTATAAQAEALVRLAEEKQVFITEAIWTRYMPLSHKIAELVRQGAIGKPDMLSANLGYVIHGKERIMRPELAGGALLDIGIYPLHFAAMAFGSDIAGTASTCLKTDTGVDGKESITLTYADGRMACLQSTIWSQTDRMGIISGDGGCLVVENINNPQSVRILDRNYQVAATYEAPPQITGFEYQVQACMEAIRNGWIESPCIPHAETLRIMHQMDALRKEWGVRYPWDEWPE